MSFKIINGTSYHIDTPSDLCDILEECRVKKVRIKVNYGDPTTGQDWLEEHDIRGYVGRSTGQIQMPLLVYNKRARGGGALLDDQILKVRETNGGYVLWEHPNYKQPTFEIVPDLSVPYPYAVYVDGEIRAAFPTVEQAYKYINKVK